MFPRVRATFPRYRYDPIIPRLEGLHPRLTDRRLFVVAPRGCSPRESLGGAMIERIADFCMDLPAARSGEGQVLPAAPFPAPI